LPRCDICAAFVQTPGLCFHCATERPLFTQARAAAPYAGQLRASLHAFKYMEKTWLRRPLAALLAQTCEQHYSSIYFDAVTPIPLSMARFKERGYNQSEMLSKLLAAEFNLKHQPALLKRVLDTPPLASYDGDQRRTLLKRAFAAMPAEGQTVLLVDDIYTSGATLDTCAAALFEAGAQAVYGLTVTAYDIRGKKPEDRRQKTEDRRQKIKDKR
jgi:ComF family protein